SLLPHMRFVFRDSPKANLDETWRSCGTPFYKQSRPRSPSSDLDENLVNRFHFLHALFPTGTQLDNSPAFRRELRLQCRLLKKSDHLLSKIDGVPHRKQESILSVRDPFSIR